MTFTFTQVGGTSPETDAFYKQLKDLGVTDIDINDIQMLVLKKIAIAMEG